MSERAPGSFVGCFIAAVDAVSGPITEPLRVLVVVDVVEAGACWVGVVEGSADSSAPVMDWKSSGVVMVKGGRPIAGALVAWCGARRG